MRLYIMVLCLNIPTVAGSWGFQAHRTINRMAVFTLPPEMMGFYKNNIQFLTENAVKPDMRRYVVKEEAARHYIDIDVYGDSAIYRMPRGWALAVDVYSEDTLKAYGIVPYHIDRVAHWLIHAFEEKNGEQILRLSTDLGHYIADANVPLHTTENYNGQFTGQRGIHGLWESRLPELFSSEYDLFTGKARYIENLQEYAWEAVVQAHEALDSVLLFEKRLSSATAESKKFGYEDRGSVSVRTHTYAYANAYHRMLNGMVERQMKKSIKMLGDFWFSCWVKAGQPDLNVPKMDALKRDSVEMDFAGKKFRNHKASVNEK